MENAPKEPVYLKRHAPYTPPYQYTDAGRHAEGFSEKMDCTVRAFALARNVPYATAHTELAKLGREPGKGFKFSVVALKHPGLFTRVVLPKGCRRRVRTLLPSLAKGRHVLRIRKHVFAVVDGVVHDTCGYHSLQNCIVTDIFTALP